MPRNFICMRKALNIYYLVTNYFFMTKDNIKFGGPKTMVIILDGNSEIGAHLCGVMLVI